jgi:hypothetical protein
MKKEISYEELVVQEAEKQMSRVIYCRYCGSQVIHCSNDRISGFMRQWEMANEVHYDCAKARGDVK